MRWIANDFGGFWDGGRRLGIIENSIDIHEVLAPCMANGPVSMERLFCVLYL